MSRFFLIFILGFSLRSWAPPMPADAEIAGQPFDALLQSFVQSDYTPLPRDLVRLAEDEGNRSLIVDSVIRHNPRRESVPVAVFSTMGTWEALPEAAIASLREAAALRPFRHSVIRVLRSLPTAALSEAHRAEFALLISQNIFASGETRDLTLANDAMIYLGQLFLPGRSVRRRVVKNCNTPLGRSTAQNVLTFWNHRETPIDRPLMNRIVVEGQRRSILRAWYRCADHIFYRR